MKRKVKYIFSFISICALVCLIFVCSGYLYIKHEFQPAKTSEESIPYYKSVPENTGILFDICGDRTLCYMDFEKGSMNLIFDTGSALVGERLYGYKINYTVNGDYSLLAGIIDIIGGIELESEGELLRHTGVQITDILSKTYDRKDLRLKIITKIIEKVSEKGFQKKDFLYIIENSETNLTVPDSYYWSEHIKVVCGEVKIIS